MYILCISPEAEDTRFDALAESLQDYFDAYGTNLKKETAAAFVPTVNKVKHIHGLLDKTIDRGFTNGLLKFDRICKDAELEAIRDHDELQATYKRGQVCLSLTGFSFPYSCCHRRA